MDKKRVLFVCIHNSARSQMAEAFLRELAGDRFVSESAGLEPGKLNQNVVKSMQQLGVDISGHKTKSLFDLVKDGRHYNYIITVCDKEAAERCPIFPGPSLKRIHWSFKDPSAIKGEDNEVLQKIGEIRDDIKSQIESFISEN